MERRRRRKKEEEEEEEEEEVGVEETLFPFNRPSFISSFL